MYTLATYNLMHQLRMRSGLKIIYQNNWRHVTEASQNQFYAYARQNLASTFRTGQPEETVNVIVTGLIKLQLTLKAEKENGHPSKFRWGSSQVSIKDYDSSASS